MIDGLGREEEPRRDLGVGEPGARSGRGPRARAGSARAGAARVAVRGPAGIDLIPSRRICCRVTRAVADAPRSVQIAQRLAQRGLVRWRRAAPARPRTSSRDRSRAGRPSPSGRRAWQPVGLGQLAGGAAGRRCGAASQTASSPRCHASQAAASRGRLELGLGRAGQVALRASAPRRGPARRSRELRLAGAVRRRRRLVQALPGAGVAAAGPDLAQAQQRVDPVDRRRRDAPQQVLAQRDRLVPVAGLLQGAGPLARAGRPRYVLMSCSSQ